MVEYLKIIFKIQIVLCFNFETGLPQVNNFHTRMVRSFKSEFALGYGFVGNKLRDAISIGVYAVFVVNNGIDNLFSSLIYFESDFVEGFCFYGGEVQKLKYA